MHTISIRIDYIPRTAKCDLLSVPEQVPVESRDGDKFTKISSLPPWLPSDPPMRPPIPSITALCQK